MMKSNKTSTHHNTFFASIDRGTVNDNDVDDTITQGSFKIGYIELPYNYTIRNIKTNRLIKDSDHVTVLTIDNNTSSMTVEEQKQKLINDMFEHITSGGTINANVYIHNLDSNWYKIKDYISKVSEMVTIGMLNYYTISIPYKSAMITMKDSHKLIPISLDEFHDMFELPEKVSNVVTRRDNTSHDDDDDLRIRHECLVLRAGFLSFNNNLRDVYDSVCKNIKAHTNKKKPFELFHYKSIADVAEALMTDFGVYDNVQEVNWSKKKYLRSARYGTAHVNRDHCKRVIEDEIISSNCVSLYTSSMVRLTQGSISPEPGVNRRNQLPSIGIPTGGDIRYKVKDKWLDEDIVNGRKKVLKHYVVSITFTSDFITRAVRANKMGQSDSSLFPIIPMRNEDGSELEYSNSFKAGHIYILDSITLDSIMSYYDLYGFITVNDFKITKGRYWNTSSDKLGHIMQLLFDEYVKAKKEDNKSLQYLLDMMFKSIYENNFKEHGDNYKDIYTDDSEVHEVISRNFDSFRFSQKISKDTHIVRLWGPNRDFNRQHITVFIQAMGKRIMNEYMKACSQVNVPIYYTDTDSIYISRRNLDDIAIAYKSMYGYELFGNNLGQFDNDLKIDGCDDVYSHKSIFLGKKSYLNQLRGSKKDTGEVVYSDIVKMHGANESSMQDHCIANYGGNYLLMYEALADGEVMNIRQHPAGSVMANFTTNGRLVRVANYTRLDFN